MKKKIIIAVILLLLVASVAFINWEVRGFEMYSEAKIAKEFAKVGLPVPYEGFLSTSLGPESSEFLLHYYSSEDPASNPQKPILYLLHGAPGGAVNFFESSYFLNRELRSQFVLIAVDRPGYGQSIRAQAVPEFSRAIAPLMQQLSILRGEYSKRKIYGLGWSFGGPLLALIAARVSQEPEILVNGELILDGAIVVASPADPEQEKFWWFNPILELPFVQWMFTSSINVANVEKMAHPAELQKMLGAWSQIRIPVAYLQGTNDQIVFPGNLEFLRQQATTSMKIYEIEGGGHSIVFSEIDLIQKILLDWVN